MDIRVGWQMGTRAEIAVTGRDLLHDHHPEFGALPGRSEIARSAFAKITWRF